MSPDFRLVVNRRVSHWGGQCIPLESTYYFLQVRVVNGPWQTCAVVEYDKLPEAERRELDDTMFKLVNECPRDGA